VHRLYFDSDPASRVRATLGPLRHVATVCRTGRILR
jgi:hypothetical protein